MDQTILAAPQSRNSVQFIGGDAAITVSHFVAGALRREVNLVEMMVTRAGIEPAAL